MLGNRSFTLIYKDKSADFRARFPALTEMCGRSVSVLQIQVHFHIESSPSFTSRFRGREDGRKRKNSRLKRRRSLVLYLSPLTREFQ